MKGPCVTQRTVNGGTGHLSEIGPQEKGLREKKRTGQGQGHSTMKVATTRGAIKDGQGRHSLVVCIYMGASGA